MPITKKKHFNGATGNLQMEDDSDEVSGKITLVNKYLNTSTGNFEVYKP